MGLDFACFASVESIALSKLVKSELSLLLLFFIVIIIIMTIPRATCARFFCAEHQRVCNVPQASYNT